MKYKITQKQYFIKLICAVIVFSCIIALSSIAYAVEIMMRDHVVVTSDEVYVKDIASLNGSDADLVSMISGIYVCKSPNPGYEREINKADLIMKLKQNNCDIGGIRFSGSAYTKVSAQEFEVKADQQKSALTAWIADKLDITEEQFRISYRKEPRDIVVSSEEIEVIFKGDEKTFMGRSVGVYMELYAQDKLLKRSAFNFSLELLKKVVVPTSIIHRDEVLTLDNVMLEQRFINAYENSYFTDIDSVVGSIAVQGMTTGEYITDKDIKPRTIVQRGESVECVLKDKNMNLRLSMQAKEDGVKGEIIHVYNPETKKTVRGLIIAESQVELVI